MKYLFKLLLVVLIFNLSCSKNKKLEKNKEIADSIIVDSNRIVNSIGETLIPSAKKALESWKEYQNIDNFIIRYYNVSILEALNNAQELSTLTKELKDSIRIKKLEVNNVIVRLNVLNNEALRLNDMVSIPSISDEEIKEEIEKILEVYSAVNTKINTIYSAEELKKTLGIEPDIFKDSTLNDKFTTNKKLIRKPKLIIKE